MTGDLLRHLPSRVCFKVMAVFGARTEPMCTFRITLLIVSALSNSACHCRFFIIKLCETWDTGWCHTSDGNLGVFPFSARFIVATLSLKPEITWEGQSPKILSGGIHSMQLKKPGLLDNHMPQRWRLWQYHLKHLFNPNINDGNNYGFLYTLWLII